MAEVPIRILIVDDNPEDRLAVRESLSEATRGEAVRLCFREAATGNGGLTAYRDEPPDCILLDQHLPDMDGLEFLARLRTKSGEVPVPVVMLTGSSDKALAAAARRAGAQEYLPKGLMGPEMLLRTIKSAHERFHLIAERRLAEAKFVATDAALRWASERISLATDSGGIGIWDWDVTHDRLTWDPWMCRLYGMQPRDIEATYALWRRYLHPEDREAAELALSEGVTGKKPFNIEFRIIWDDGSVHHIRGCGRLTHNPTGDVVRIVGANWDVTERAEQYGLLLTRQHELDIAHQQLDATLANLSQGVSFYDEDRRLIFCNRRYTELYGLADDAVRPGMPLAEVAELRIAAGSFSTHTVDEYLIAINGIVRAGKPHDAIIELTNGRIISTHLKPLPEHGWVATHEDITERRRAEVEIAFLARHDPLTGLANRALFQERLGQALALAERGKGFAVLCLDLDRFKAVNDSFGHPIGDSLLRAAASRMQAVVRESDTIARMGGDEFAILQLGVSEVAETAAMSRRIIEAITEPFELEGHHVSVGTSIGIAMAPTDSAHPVQLMHHADLALYRCKQEGRGTWKFFEPAMDAIAKARRAIEVDLRGALSAGQFELHFQPIITSKERKLTGFEALLRWRHPTRGIVSPGDFVSIAEEIGLIAEIGAWALHQACAEAATWPDYLRVAVNLSTRQFRGRALVATVADAIRTSGLRPERLELEITESVPLRDDHATMEILHDIHALGIRVALDDFGTGYSSLSYLRAFPFDTIKIDQSFVGDINTSDVGGAIILGIITLASSLHVNVTAEGVETAEQFEFLADAGCTEIQGYLISRPVAACDLPVLIERLKYEPHSSKQLFAKVGH